jgi:hypothetical protein
LPHFQVISRARKSNDLDPLGNRVLGLRITVFNCRMANDAIMRLSR